MMTPEAVREGLKRWFVHYAAATPGGLRYCVSGPYSFSDVVVKRRDIADAAHNSDVYVSEDPKHPKDKPA